MFFKRSLVTLFDGQPSQKDEVTDVIYDVGKNFTLINVIHKDQLSDLENEFLNV